LVDAGIVLALLDMPAAVEMRTSTAARARPPDRAPRREQRTHAAALKTEKKTCQDADLAVVRGSQRRG
jgi:hypothetical protein